VRFILPLPPSVNNLFATRRGKRVPSPRYRAWRDEAGMMVLHQRVGRRLPDPPYHLDVWLFPNDRRERDADNYHKAPQDLLASVLHFDDSEVIDASQHLRQRPNLAQGRCIVYLHHSLGWDELEWMDLYPKTT